MVKKDVQYEMKFAWKIGNVKKRDFLKVVLGEFERISKDITDQEAINVIKKMHKNAVEMDNDYEQKVLDQWMPKQISEEGLTRLIANIIADNEYTEMSDLGKIMQELKNHSGVDMKFASKCARELL